MDPIAMSKTESAAVLSRVVESKITRSELIEIVVERVRAELNEKKARLEAFKKTVDLPFTVEEGRALLKAAGDHVKLETSSTYDYDLKKSLPCLSLSIQLENPKFQLPKKIASRMRAVADLDEKIRSITHQLRRLEHGKTQARREILMSALRSTPEGSRILEAIDSFKETIRDQLTGEKEVGL